MTLTMTFVKRQKECWPSWGPNSQSLDWQTAWLPTELQGLGSFLEKFIQVEHPAYSPYCPLWLVPIYLANNASGSPNSTRRALGSPIGQCLKHLSCVTQEFKCVYLFRGLLHLKGWREQISDAVTILNQWHTFIECPSFGFFMNTYVILMEFPSFAEDLRLFR